MTIALALLLIAAGAILIWVVHGDVSGIDVHTVGVIVFVVGLAGLLVALVFTFSRESWGPRHRRDA